VRRDEDAGEAEGEKSGESVGDHALLLRCYARRRIGEIDGLCAGQSWRGVHSRRRCFEKVVFCGGEALWFKETCSTE
jgi:hypothetical protein